MSTPRSRTDAPSRPEPREPGGVFPGDDADAGALPSQETVNSDAGGASNLKAPSLPRGNPGLLPSTDPEASTVEAKRRADEDRELIKKAQSGDQAAFRSLVDRHQRRAFAIALGLVRDENDARDLVQEAFLRVYRGLGTFEGGSSFFTWLYRIVTNLAIDLMRKPGRRDAELDENHGEEDGGELPFVSRIDGADPIDVVRRREIAGRIQAALDALPPYHQSVILMREVEGMSYEEMAQAMAVSKGTIMSRLFHARQKLQRTLADCYAEDHAPQGARAKDGAALVESAVEPSVESSVDGVPIGGSDDESTSDGHENHLDSPMNEKEAS